MKMVKNKKLRQWISRYLHAYHKTIFRPNVSKAIIDSAYLCKKTRASGKKIILIGNGASNSIASHAAADLTKQANLPAVSISDAAMITAFANDLGYAKGFQRTIEKLGMPQDTLICISSSGCSPNILNAAKVAKKMEISLITFTGFYKTNPLKKIGNINFWVNSRAYNIIECTHMIWITTLIDLIIGKSEYSVKN